MHRKTRFPTLPYSYQRSVILTTFVLALILLGACARQHDSTPKTASGPVIELLPPVHGAGTLSVRLAGSDGNPITSAEVSLEGNMNHAGMVPVLSDPVADDTDGSTDGVYVVPFEFSMFGDWIVTVSTVVDGETVTQDFALSIDGEGAELIEP